MIYLRLFYEFSKTGLFTFGGALAAIPFLNETADKTGWFTRAQLADMIAIAESTPGPIGINMATYAGYTTAGVLGGVIASLGLIAPSVVIVLVLARLLKQFQENRIVRAVFYGLRPASLGLISAAGLGFMRFTFFKDGLSIDFKAIILAAILFVLIGKVKAHPAVFLAVSAVAGIILKL